METYSFRANLKVVLSGTQSNKLFISHIKLYINSETVAFILKIFRAAFNPSIS